MEASKTRENLYHLSRKRCSVFLVWACFLLFVTMMASKNVYTAETVTLQGVFNKSKAEIALAMTYYFVVYAIMQLLLSLFISKINLGIYLTITAGLSSILTILISIGNLNLIYVLCAVNGALQAGIYSGCMAVLSKYLLKNLLPFANAVMSSGTAVSGVVSYGVSALFVGLGHWELPFIILGALFFISVVIFFVAVKLMKRFPPEVIEDHGKIIVAHEEKPFVPLKTGADKAVYLGLLLVLTLISNCMHYGVMNWMPDMLHELFGMPQSYSILITLIAPLIMLVGSFIAIFSCEKVKNILTVNTVSSVVAFVMLIPLLFFYKANIVVTLGLLIVFIGSSYMGRVVFAGIMSMKMRSQINAGAYTASTNAMASIAAGVMPPIAGHIITGNGYGSLFLTVLILFAVFAILLLMFNIFVAHKNSVEVKNVKKQ